MIAALPMYARPQNRAAHDMFWAAIRDGLSGRGVEAPEALDHDIGHVASWQRPDLVLSQICNLPWVVAFSATTTPVALPDLGLEGAPPGSYYSVLVTRRDDPRDRFPDFDGATLAINDDASQSGWGAPCAAAAAAGIAFGRVVETGAHFESARAVAEGRADIAALDAATLRLIRRWGDVAHGLREIGRTPPTPAPAYVTAGDVDPAPYLSALQEAFEAMPAEVRVDLGLRAILPVDRAAYAALPVPPAPPR
jgi:ABC-type phosphate/phosphonate transport system substrate-binding protein